MCRKEILGCASWVLLLYCMGTARSQCTGGCPLAYGSYLVKENDTLDNILNLFSPGVKRTDVQQSSGLSDPNFIDKGSSLMIPFSCECINGSFLGHNFLYAVQSGDTYEKIAKYYSNLTSPAWLQATTSVLPTQISDKGNLNVAINCSCGNPEVLLDYGLFLTYPLKAGDNISGLSSRYNVSRDLLQKYNPNADKLGSGLVFIPVKGSFQNHYPCSLLLHSHVAFCQFMSWFILI